MMLYSYRTCWPQELPFRIRLSDGFTRTDPSTFTAEEIADAGFTGPYTEPVYDPDTEVLNWDPKTLSFYITPKPEDTGNLNEDPVPQQQLWLFVCVFTLWESSTHKQQTHTLTAPSPGKPCGFPR